MVCAALFAFLIMNIYQLAIAKSTPEEAARLIQDMSDESEKYRVALETLRKQVFDVVSKPDYTNPEEMVRKLRDSLANALK